MLSLVKNFVLSVWDARKNDLYGGQNGETSGLSFPLSGDLASFARVCGCVVAGIIAMAATRVYYTTLSQAYMRDCGKSTPPYTFLKKILTALLTASPNTVTKKNDYCTFTEDGHILRMGTTVNTDRSKCIAL